jgi:hypothetical protein
MSDELPAEMEKLAVGEQLDENGQPLSKNALKKLEKAKKVAEEKAAKEAAKQAKLAEQGGSEKKKVRNLRFEDKNIFLSDFCRLNRVVKKFSQYSRVVARASRQLENANIAVSQTVCLFQWSF